MTSCRRKEICSCDSWIVCYFPERAIHESHESTRTVYFFGLGLPFRLVFLALVIVFAEDTSD